MKILVLVGTQQKGFFVSLIHQLSTCCDIVITASGEDVRAFFSERCPGIPIELVQDRSDSYLDDATLLKQCAEAEARYNTRFGMLCSQDRAFGYGYLFNATAYPQPTRAGWSWQRKYATILNELLCFEDLHSKHHFDLVLSLAINRRLWLVCESHAIPCLGIGMVKFGKRIFWTDCPEYTSKHFRALLESAVAEWHPSPDNPPPELEREVAAVINHAKARIGLKRAFKDLAYQVARDIYATLIGNRKVGGYRLFAWVPGIFRELVNYRHLSLHGVTPDDLPGRRVVYLPLHLEPEIALLEVSPEFNNTQEMITWISKSAPADTVIVLREHPYSYGVRPSEYYRRLGILPNVVFSKPAVNSWDWIARADVIATITGTTAIEAIYFDKPVLSYGKHQLVNELPSVRYVYDHDSTQAALNDFLERGIGKDVLRCSRDALYRAQLAVSFELAGFEKSYASEEPSDELAAIAIQALHDQYPISPRP